MNILTPEEKAFLDVFIHEATTSPFTGPATEAIHKIGVAYSDIRSLAWAYNREAPCTTHGWGHAADVAPPLPWLNREAVLKRDEEIRRLSEQREERPEAPRAAG